MGSLLGGRNADKVSVIYKLSEARNLFPTFDRHFAIYRISVSMDGG